MRYHIWATVNYPDDEVDTPESIHDIDSVRSWITKLLEKEKDATSFVITISRGMHGSKGEPE